MQAMGSCTRRSGIRLSYARLLPGTFLAVAYFQESYYVMGPPVCGQEPKKYFRLCINFGEHLLDFCCDFLIIRFDGGYEVYVRFDSTTNVGNSDSAIFFKIIYENIIITLTTASM